VQHLRDSQTPIDDDLDSIGGENLSGSGFETEEPDTYFTGVDPEVEE